jgi:predicted membrane protein
VRTSVSVDAGEARVIVPANVNVDVTCTADVGDVRCLNASQNWRDISMHQVDNVPNAVGTLQLDVHAGAGDVEVVRG